MTKTAEEIKAEEEAAKYKKTIDYRVIGFVEEGSEIKAVASGRLLINLSKLQ